MWLDIRSEPCRPVHTCAHLCTTPSLCTVLSQSRKLLQRLVNWSSLIRVMHNQDQPLSVRTVIISVLPHVCLIGTVEMCWLLLQYWLLGNQIHRDNNTVIICVHCSSLTEVIITWGTVIINKTASVTSCASSSSGVCSLLFCPPVVGQVVWMQQHHIESHKQGEQKMSVETQHCEAVGLLLWLTNVTVVQTDIWFLRAEPVDSVYYVLPAAKPPIAIYIHTRRPLSVPGSNWVVMMSEGQTDGPAVERPSASPEGCNSFLFHQITSGLSW